MTFYEEYFEEILKLIDRIIKYGFKRDKEKLKSVKIKLIAQYYEETRY